MEIRLVLHSLVNGTSLAFDELERDLCSAQQAAGHAYESAWKCFHGGTSDTQSIANRRWTQSAIPGRRAATQAASGEINPMSALGDRLEQFLWKLPRLDPVGDAMELRPTCPGKLVLTGAECARPAIYFGSGRFGSHCRLHATPNERDRLTLYRQQMATELAIVHEKLLRRQRSVGESIAGYWLQHRESRRDWLDRLSVIAPSVD